MDQPPVNETHPPQYVQQPKQNLSDIVRSWIKDAIYIAMFIVISSGWLITSISNRQVLEDTVGNNTRAMEDLKTELKGINEFLNQQRTLNGQFLEFMDSHDREERNNDNN